MCPSQGIGSLGHLDHHASDFDPYFLGGSKEGRAKQAGSFQGQVENKRVASKRKSHVAMAHNLCNRIKEKLNQKTGAKKNELHDRCSNQRLKLTKATLEI